MNGKRTVRERHGSAGRRRGPVGTTRRPAVLSAAAVALSLVAACSGGSGPAQASVTTGSPAATIPTSSTSTPSSTSTRSSTRPAPDSKAASSSDPTKPTKLMVVVLENHSSTEAEQGMPHLAAQAARYAKTTESYGVSHPSLPNYLAIAGGSTFGVSDDNPPSDHQLTGESVFGQVLASGHVAKTYAEAMTSNCEQDDSGSYAVRHNPWAYFSSASERQACDRYDVPAGTLTAGPLHDDVAAGTLPTFSMLIPDVCNDAHDCSLATADTWVSGWLDQIEAGPDFRAGRLAVLVTFDEDDLQSGNHIMTTVINPRLLGVTIATRFDHYAVSGVVSRLVGGTPLRDAAQAPDLLGTFALAPTP